MRVFGLLALLVTSISISSAEVVYDFSGWSFGSRVQFQITSPTLITSFERFHASELDYCTGCYPGSDAFAVTIHPSTANGDWLGYASAAYGPQNPSFAYFPTGTFSTPGMYTYEGSTLSITATPEPSFSIALAIFATVLVVWRSSKRITG